MDSAPLLLSSSAETVPVANIPRTDVSLLAQALGAPVIYPPTMDANSLFSRLEKRIAADVRQAIAALKRRTITSVYVSLSEKVAVPLAWLLPQSRDRRPAHVVIAHHLTSANKRTLQTHTGYLSRFDRIITLGTAQTRYLTDEVKLPTSCVTQLRHAVDTRFWSPPVAPAPNGGYLLAVGRERRDYETLARALRGLPDTQCVVVASSPWSQQTGDTVTGDVPPNLTFQQNLPYETLRDRYAGASAVVVPLETGTAYAAGATACLEAMAMARPVIATDTPGLADYVTDGSGDALVVPVAGGDATALQAAIGALLGDAARRETLGANGRRFVATSANVDDYVAQVAAVVLATM